MIFHIDTKKIPSKKEGIFKIVRLDYYTIPCANIASATFTKPATFAPFT